MLIIKNFQEQWTVLKNILLVCLAMGDVDS